MIYSRRKKGGQRLMEISRSGVGRRAVNAKRKAARKAKTLAQAKANIAKGPVTRGGVKKKVAPAKAAPKKKVATPKSDAGKYMGPYSKRTTSAKKKTPAKPTAGRRTDAKRAADKKKLLAEQKRVRAAGNKKSLTRFIPQMSVKKAEKAGSGLRLGGEVGLALAALAGSGGTAAPAVATTGGGRAVLSGLSRLKNLFKKSKPKGDTLSVPGGRGSGLGGGKPPAVPKPKPKPKKKKTAEEIRADKRAALRRSTK